MRRVMRMAALVAAIVYCAMPSFGKEHGARKVNDASPEGIARLVERIQDNAGRIRRLSFVFRAPGYPREDIQRSQLVRANLDLLLRAEIAARKLLAPIRNEPPPGQWAWWQLLRDTESGAHSARLLNDFDFRDQSIARRFAALRRKEPDKGPSVSPVEPSRPNGRKAE